MSGRCPGACGGIYLSISPEGNLDEASRCAAPQHRALCIHLTHRTSHPQHIDTACAMASAMTSSLVSQKVAICTPVRTRTQQRRSTVCSAAPKVGSGIHRRRYCEGNQQRPNRIWAAVHEQAAYQGGMEHRGMDSGAQLQMVSRLEKLYGGSRRALKRKTARCWLRRMCGHGSERLPRCFAGHLSHFRHTERYAAAHYPDRWQSHAGFMSLRLHVDGSSLVGACAVAAAAAQDIKLTRVALSSAAGDPPQRPAGGHRWLRCCSHPDRAGADGSGRRRQVGCLR